MSLVKKPEMSDANRAAHRANGRKSRGAKTSAGKERARAANLRHGYYSDVRDGALEALGEDPAKLRGLIDAAYEEWRPQGDYQSALVERSARLLWRMDRAERVQESLAVESVGRFSDLRNEQAHALHDRYCDQEVVLGLLVANAARPDFYAYPKMVSDFTQEFGEPGGEDTQRILELLVRLRKPRQFSPHSQPLEGEVATDADWLAGLPEEGEEGEFPAGLPGLPVAEGAERDPLRRELRDLAAALLNSTERAWETTLAKFRAEPSSLDRDTLWEQAQPQRQLMLREEESCFRQFWRLTRILMGMQQRRQELEKPQSAKQDSGSRIQESGIQDSAEQSSAVGGGPPQPRAADSAAARPKRAKKSGSAPAPFKNAGASGDVHENTGEQNGEPAPEASDERTKRPEILDLYPAPWGSKEDK